MATSRSFGKGVLTFFILIFTSIVLFTAIVWPAERTLTLFEQTSVLSDGSTMYTIDAPWDMAYTDALFWMNLLYIVGVMPALLGLFILFTSSIRTQSYDVFADSSQNQQVPYDLADSGASATPQVVVPQYFKGGFQ